MAINNVTLAGNLVSDLEVRATPSGYPIGNGTVAVNKRHKNAQGGYEDVASYFDFKVLGERAEKLAQYLVKGTKVAISGELEQERWTDKETGKGRSKVVVLVDGLDFMSRQQGQQQRAYGQQQAYAPQPQQAYRPVPQGHAPQQQAYRQAAPQAVEPSLYDADIPFD